MYALNSSLSLVFQIIHSTYSINEETENMHFSYDLQLYFFLHPCYNFFNENKISAQYRLFYFHLQRKSIFQYHKRD